MPLLRPQLIISLDTWLMSTLAEKLQMAHLSMLTGFINFYRIYQKTAVRFQSEIQNIFVEDISYY